MPFNRPKLLGVLQTENSTGKSQCEATLTTAQEWHFLDRIIGTCFDTTASNKGIRQGEASLIEVELKRALLWLACRHHHCELHIKHAFTALKGERDRPKEPLFKRFKQDLSGFDINYSNSTFFEWPMDESSPIYEQAKSVLNWAQQCLAEKTFPREDYRELVELTLIYLGGQLPDGRVFKFRIPGAFHHARFMAQSIYLLKIHLLSVLFSMSTEETRMVYRMANFIALLFK